MSDPVAARPAICLSMIVRNEAAIIRETLDNVAPYISSWVIVDTGSDDGTQDVIREHMAGLGIPGELHERPWRNFGHNRTEALSLARGHGDYIWVMDADDLLVGTPDFTQLDADVYAMRMGRAANLYWYPVMFRSTVPIHYVGVVHEYPAWDGTYTEERLDGDYHIEDRHVSSRNVSGQKFANDRDLLLAEVERNPGDTRSVFYLAQSFFNLGDFANSRKWYQRRVEMGGWDQEVYYSMFRIAESMARLELPWPQVRAAYLKAWEFRPTRAEPLYAIARRYRVDGRYPLGYLFAERAAQIPFPEQDNLFVGGDVYRWRAADEQAVCASWIGKHTEAFALCRRLIAIPDLPDSDRARIATNRDFSVPAMLEATAGYPQQLVADLAASTRDGEVTVTMIAGPDRVATEQTLNSFVTCCTDIARIGRFLVVDAGLAATDRAALAERYPFVEFGAPDAAPSGVSLGWIRSQVHTRFWLHLGQGWRFFAPEAYITRLTAVLEAEPQVLAVGVNFADATKLTGACAVERVVLRAPGAGRYVPAHAVATGPAMFDTALLDRAGGFAGADADVIPALWRRAAAAGLRTTSLDEVLCIAGS